MSRPVIGIIGNLHVINDQYRTQAAGEMNIRAIAQVCDALPLVVPSLPDAVHVHDLLEACAGIVFTGGRPNVHPSHYGHEETPGHGPFDPDRDALTLPLIRACVERGVPILGLCRGFQEFNVAFGGTLHPEIRDLPGRMNHRMPPDGSIEEKFALRHPVHLTQGGKFAQLWGRTEVMVNSLHGQGIIDPGKRVVIEGHAPDGTPEAIHIAGAPTFAMAVQWHAEWRAAEDPVSRPLFEAFAAASRSAARHAA
ncbi:MAG TPA: gamma-glutamyl-gamma-aminobutyrate hydrolase family protein [Paracoccaceae bacterium]|nr:gamma-glutamyl-gamma-aminobutyrate hydrolase family protein [Paracoccaceae bacterium]